MKKTRFILLTFVMVLLSSFASATYYDTTNSSNGLNYNLEAYYTFDNASLSDYTSNTNDLTNSGATWTSSGKLNGAYDFDGSNDNMDLPQILNSPTEFSYSMWLYSDSTTQLVPLSYNNDGIYTVLISHLSTTDVYAGVRDSLGTQSVQATQTLTDGYHHIVVTAKENDYMYLYIDGVNQGNDSLTTFATVSTLARKLGSDRNGGQFFNGRVDEFSMFSRVLNQTEITQLYASGSPTVTEQYPFNNENNLIARLEASYEPTNYDNLTASLLDQHNNNDLTANGDVSWHATNGWEFDGTGDYLQMPQSVIDATDSANSVSFDIKFTSATTGMTIIDYDVASTANDRWNLQTGTVAGTLRMYLKGGATAMDIQSTTAINDGNWHKVVLVADTSIANDQAYLYIDGVLENSVVGGLTTDIDTLTTAIIGGVETPAGSFIGSIDNLRTYNRFLTSDDVTYLYSGTENNYDFNTQLATIIESVNESTEGLIVNYQTGSVSTSTLDNNVTISDINFNIDVNSTPYYFTHTVQVEAGGGASKEVTCDVLVNGSVRGTQTRTIPATTTGSFYIMTDVLTNNTGTYNEVLQCRKTSGTGVITMSDAVAVGHILVDYSDEILNYDYTELEDVWGNESSYVDYYTISFTTSNKTLDENHSLDLIVDWVAQFNHTDEDMISVDIDLSDGQSCAHLTRDSNTGGTGIGGSVCLLKNLTVDTAYNITLQIWVGTTTNVTVLDNIKIVTKEFVQDIEERGTYQFFDSLSTTFEELTSFNITNIDHSSVDIFSFLSTEIAPSGGVSGDIQQQINILNGDTLTGLIIENSIPANERRISMNQEVLQDASQSTYTIQVNASCTAATCSAFSGEVTAYFANIIPFTLNSFNVTAYDIYDNTPITDFNVTTSSGTKYISINGTATILGSGTLNLTITTDEGYFDQPVINHDASTNLNQSMNQTLISWSCNEKVSGNDLNCTSPVEGTVFNYNVVGNPHSQSVNVTGYYETLTSFNVTALQNQTLNATVHYSTNLTINSVSLLAVPSTCVYNITSNDYSWTESLSGSPNTTAGLINGSYDILADCDGFAYQTQNVTIENSTQTITFTLLTTNSFNFLFRDAQSLDLLTSINVTAELISESDSSNYTTTNGTLYIDLLTPEFYTIRFDADGYSERFYYFQLTDRSFNNITLYLLNESVGQDVTITIVDDNDEPLQEAYLKILRYDITSNAYLLQEIYKSDVEGKVYIETEIGTEFYKFFVDYPFGTTVYSSSPQYIEETTFILPVILNPLYGQSFFNSLGVSGNIVFNDVTNNFRWEYTDNLNTISGACLYVYETSLVTNTLLGSSCADTSSGTILVPITPVNGSSYSAVGVILYDSTEYYWGEKNYKAGGIQDEDTKKFRLFLILLLTLTIILLFAWNPTLLLIFAPVPMLIGSLINYIEFSTTISLGLMAGGVVLAYMINKKS